MILALLAPPTQAQTNTLTSLLQAGLLDEEANHDLNAAITDYQSLATQFDKDRQIAATAIYRLGECYRKLGKTNEAVFQYQRVVRDFSDQKTLATLSRQNLAGIGATAPDDKTAVSQDAALWNKLKDLTLLELEGELPILVPNPVLTALLQDRNTIQAKLASLSSDFGPANPDVVRTKKLLEVCDGQVAETAKAMARAIKLRAEISQSGSMVSPGPAPAGAETEEDQEIQRIKLTLQNSPDLITGHNGELCTAAAQGKLRVAAFLLDQGADVNAESGGFIPLLEAAKAGQKKMVEFLLARGAVVNAGNKGNETALALAAAQGYQAVVEVLLAHKADPNLPDNSGRTALSHAIEKRSVAIEKLLLAAKADPNPNGKSDAPLLCAVYKQNVEVAELVLQAGADPNILDQDRIQYGTTSGNSQNRMTPLLLAVRTHQLPMVELLLKFKANPNDSGTEGRSLLFNLYYNNFPVDTNILETLLNAGAKANAREIFPPDPASGSGGGGGGFIARPPSPAVNQTLLDIAVREGNAVAVELLLKHGADPNVRGGGGYTALHWAANQLLVDQKASQPRAQAERGRVAAGFGRGSQTGQPTDQFFYRRIFEMLLDHHAEPNLRNEAGETPLEMLTRSKGDASADIAAGLLRQHGALDNLPNWDAISVSRSPAGTGTKVFQNGATNWNEFTVLELVIVQSHILAASPFESPQAVFRSKFFAENTMPYPDFARLKIHRPSPASNSWTELTVDLSAALKSGVCSNNVLLKWGDVVEIPEAEHPLEEKWGGFTEGEMANLKKCLTRHIQVAVNGRTNMLTLALGPALDGSRVNPSLIDSHVSYWLRPVLFQYKQALTTSDLSHVRVTRHETESGRSRELIVNCDGSYEPSDIWLRDGDIVEVPERP